MKTKFGRLRQLYESRLGVEESDGDAMAARQSAMTKIKDLTDAIRVVQRPVLGSEIDEVMHFCFKNLPISDIEAINRNCYQGKMFEDPGELGELSIMAKLYDIAAIRLGMGSQWVNLVHQQAAGREENTKLALQKKKDRVKNLKRVANEHGVSAAMAAWCVVLAVMNFHSEWIYDLSKWAMCAGCLFYGRNLWKNGARRVLIPLGILTVVFNPIAPIRFSEDEWKVVDWIGAVAFMGYVPKVILFVIKLPGILWRAFNTGPNDDDDVRIWFAERFLVVFFVIAASVIAYGCWRDSTPEGKLHRAAEEAKWAAQRAERDAAEKARRDLMRPKATESAFHTDNAVIGSYGYRKSNGSVVGPGTAEVDLQDPKNKDWYPGKSFTAPK